MKKIILLLAFPSILCAGDFPSGGEHALDPQIEETLNHLPTSIKDQVESLKECYAGWEDELARNHEIDQETLNNSVQLLIGRPFNPTLIGEEVAVSEPILENIRTELGLLRIPEQSIRIYGIASQEAPSCGTVNNIFIVNTPRLSAHSAEAQKFIIRSNLIQMKHNDSYYFQALQHGLNSSQEDLANPAYILNKFDTFTTMRSDLLSAAASAQHALGGYKAVTGDDITTTTAIPEYSIPSLEQYTEQARAGLFAYLYQCHTQSEIAS